MSLKYIEGRNFYGQKFSRFLTLSAKVMAAKVLKLVIRESLCPKICQNWLSVKVRRQNLTLGNPKKSVSVKKFFFKFSNFSKYFYKWPRFKEITTCFFNCNVFIYFFICRSIIKRNEVDSKNVYIKENFLCNLQECQKPPLCKHSLK